MPLVVPKKKAGDTYITVNIAIKKHDKERNHIQFSNDGKESGIKSIEQFNHEMDKIIEKIFKWMMEVYKLTMKILNSRIEVFFK